MRCVLYCAFFAIAVAAITALGSEQPVMPTLGRVHTKTGKSYVGEVLKNSDTAITLRLLDTGKRAEYKKAGLAKVEAAISEGEAARYVGLPQVLAWKVAALARRVPAVGKVAKVNPNFVYLTLGVDSGLAVGQELDVFRNSGDVIDPDTKAVLASDRQKIAKAQVTEVGKNYSKARMLGDIESELKVGDEVQLPSERIRVAVFPIGEQNGDGAGAAIAEQLTTSLVGKGIDVVERSLLQTALTELAIQNSALFDEKTAQTVGKQLGANVVLAGKIVVSGNKSEVHVRLIQVASGTILLAMSQPLSATGPAAPAAGGGGGAGGDSAEDRDWKTFGSKTRWPSYLHGGDAAAIGKDGLDVRKNKAVYTKQGDFLKRNFVFEAEYTFSVAGGREQGTMYCGIGAASANGDSPEQFVQLAEFPPASTAKGHVAIFRKNGGPGGAQEVQKLGAIVTNGPHRLRIGKSGAAVTFSIDADNDGKSADDLEFTVPDFQEFAPFLHEKNGYLFIGGGVVFQKVRLTILP